MTMEVVLIACNWELLNRCDYDNKQIVKWLIRNHWALYQYGTTKGDGVALAVWVDLSKAIRTKGVLTFKQKKYILLWADGWTQYEIGVKYRVSQVAVSLTIKAAVKNICKYLNKYLYYTPSHGILSEGGMYEN